MSINSSSLGSVTQVGSLYCVGNLSLLNFPCVSVIGTRKIDQSSSRWLKNMIGQLSNTCVVSGLALGTDTIAHKSALANHLPTIAVLPSGFNCITPKSNLPLAKQIIANGGLLVSQYSPNTQVANKQYIERNKIIADLGKYLIVPQFEFKSGTRHTVDFAQQKKKMIVVQNANYSGNRFIINNKDYHTFSK